MLRIMLAALSGVAVAWYLEHRDGFSFWEPIDYLVSGCLFAAAVLCPELPIERMFVRRSLALVAASTLSFYVAVTVALEAPRWLGAEGATTLGAVLLASSAGAGIVLVAACRLITFGRPVHLWVAAALAVVLGGFAMQLALEADRFAVTAAGFAIWHALLCFAMRLGRGSVFGRGSVRASLNLVRRLLPGGALWRSGEGHDFA